VVAEKKMRNYKQMEYPMPSTKNTTIFPKLNLLFYLHSVRFFSRSSTISVSDYAFSLPLFFFLAPTSFEVSGDSTCQPFICVKVAKFMLYGAEILIRKLANLALQASAGKIHRPAPHFPPHT